MGSLGYYTEVVSSAGSSVWPSGFESQIYQLSTLGILSYLSVDQFSWVRWKLDVTFVGFKWKNAYEVLKTRPGT